MKNFKIIVLSLAFSMLFVACNDDFLNVENFDAIDADEFISNVKGAQTAVNGVYHAQYMDYTWRGQIYYYLLFASGELNYRHALPEELSLTNFGYMPEGGWYSGYWRDLYKIVGRSNDVGSKLYKLQGSSEGKAMSPGDQEKIDQMIGECQFMRAFGYMWLTRSFGDKLPSHPEYNVNELGVPISDSIISVKEQLIIPRNTLGECWDLIIKDFKTAYAKLPSKWGADKIGAATKGAAAGYLGTIAMHYGNNIFPDGSGEIGYKRAKYWFEQCMNDAEAGYELVDDYYWNFDLPHENNSESIYEIQFDNKTRNFPGSYTHRLLGPNPVWWGTVNIPMSVIEKFSKGYELTQDGFDEMVRRPGSAITGPDSQKVLKYLLTQVYSKMVGNPEPYGSRLDMFEAFELELFKKFQHQISTDSILKIKDGQLVVTEDEKVKKAAWIEIGDAVTEIAKNATAPDKVNFRFDLIKKDDITAISSKDASGKIKLDTILLWGTVDSRYFKGVANLCQADTDPRLGATAYIPGVDSVRTASNGAYGAYTRYLTRYYGYKKGIPDDAVEYWASAGLSDNDGHNSVNQRLLRLGEIYLQYAEACYRLNPSDPTAIEYYNKIHRRGWGITDSSRDYDPDDWKKPGDDADPFMAALVRQYELELCGEGSMHFHYLRWWKASYGAVNRYASRGFDPTKHHRLPIPQSECDVVGSMMKQNSGYN